MTQCPHVVHHNFEYSSGLRALYQMLVSPQDSKKAVRGRKKTALELHFLHQSSTWLSFHQQVKSIEISKTIPTYYKRTKNLLHSGKYLSLLNATINVINFWTIVHIFQCSTACKLNYTGYILMASLVKEVIAFTAYYFVLKAKEKKKH